MTDFHMCEHLSTFPAYCAIQLDGFGFQIICHTPFLTSFLDAKLIVRLKNKTMLEVSTCGMSPTTCALCACEPFMRVR